MSIKKAVYICVVFLLLIALGIKVSHWMQISLLNSLLAMALIVVATYVVFFILDKFDIVN